MVHHTLLFVLAAAEELVADLKYLDYKGVSVDAELKFLLMRVCDYRHHGVDAH